MAGRALTSSPAAIDAPGTRRVAAPAARPAPRRPAVLARAAAATDGPATMVGVKDSVRCYMTAEGNLVCERLEPGNYKLSAAENTAHAGDESAGAPRCDSLNPKDCITYCYVMEDGSMVCEGLPSGDYQIAKATDDDLPSMVEHAQKLRDGVSNPMASVKESAPEAPVAEAKGLASKVVGKIKGIFGGGSK